MITITLPVWFAYVWVAIATLNVANFLLSAINAWKEAKEAEEMEKARLG